MEWKKTIDNNVGIVFKSKTNKYKGIDAWKHISGSYWIISIKNNLGAVIQRKKAKTKESARKFLFKYMKNHPNG